DGGIGDGLDDLARTGREDAIADIERRDAFLAAGLSAILGAVGADRKHLGRSPADLARGVANPGEDQRDDLVAVQVGRALVFAIARRGPGADRVIAVAHDGEAGMAAAGAETQIGRIDRELVARMEFIAGAGDDLAVVLDEQAEGTALHGAFAVTR